MMQLMALATTALLALGGGGGKVKWVQGYEEGMKVAKRTGAAAMVYFTADW